MSYKKKEKTFIIIEVRVKLCMFFPILSVGKKTFDTSEKNYCEELIRGKNWRPPVFEDFTSKHYYCTDFVKYSIWKPFKSVNIIVKNWFGLYFRYFI
jgi:hypothetical protein